MMTQEKTYSEKQYQAAITQANQEKKKRQESDRAMRGFMRDQLVLLISIPSESWGPDETKLLKKIQQVVLLQLAIAESSESDNLATSVESGFIQNVLRFFLNLPDRLWTDDEKDLLARLIQSKA